MRGLLGRMLGHAGFPDQPRQHGGSVAVFPFVTQPDYEPFGLPGVECSLHGTCPVCGTESDFSRFTSNLRESGFCSSCGSFNRQRQVAHMLRKTLGLPAQGPLVFADEYVIYNTETTGAMHTALSGPACYLCSEYFGDQVEPGEVVGGRRHEDLQRLSFADTSIDLVLSTDVLEHMPDPYKAHREIFRVLKPGGRHIVTVPFNAHEALDDVRATMVEDGSIRYLAEKQFHGDPVRPDEGHPGLDHLRAGNVRATGGSRLRARRVNLYEPAEGIVAAFSLVFEARWPDTPPA